MLSLQEIITATGGHCENMQELIFTGITTDSRIESSGELFVALCGERFDGHAYCKMALEHGAAAVLVFEQLEQADMDLMVGATYENIMMVEGEMDEVSEQDLLEAMKAAHDLS